MVSTTNNKSLGKDHATSVLIPLCFMSVTGRFIITNANVTANETVVCDEAFAAVVNSKIQKSFCNYCFKVRACVHFNCNEIKHKNVNINYLRFLLVFSFERTQSLS